MEPALKSFPLLEELEVKQCDVLIKTPSQFPSLKYLRVNDGSESLVKSLSNKASTLIGLRIGGIYDMTSLPQGLLQRNNLLRELIIFESPEIRSLPEELRNLKSLESLLLWNCKSLTIEPDLITCLTSLRSLTIMGVKEMASSSSSLSLSLSEWQLCKLPLLYELGIGGFPDEPDVFPFIEGIEQIDLLVSLNICGWPKLTTLPQLQHLTKLQALMIMDFQGLVELPNWLTNLSSLRSFTIMECENLKYLPEDFSSSSISQFEIMGCPLLKERCTSVTGEEWHKITHIPLVEFSD